MMREDGERLLMMNSRMKMMVKSRDLDIDINININIQINPEIEEKEKEKEEEEEKGMENPDDIQQERSMDMYMTHTTPMKKQEKKSMTKNDDIEKGEEKLIDGLMNSLRLKRF